MAVRLLHPHPFLRRCFYQKNSRKYLRRFVIGVAACLFFCCFVSSFTFMCSAAWGEPVDYSDLDYKVQYGNGFNTVTFPLPADNYVLKAWNTTQDLEVSNYGQTEIVFGAQSEYYDNFKIYIYPASTFGLSLSNIPVGAKIHMQVKIENLSEAGYTMPDWYLRYWYANDNAAQLLNGTDLMGEQAISGTYNLDYVIQSVAGATRFVPSVLFNNFRPMADNAMYRIKLVSASIEMQVSTEFWSQFQNQQNGEVLNDIADTMDEMVSGGAEGEILDQKDDSMADSAGAVNDGLGKIESFQSGYMDAAAKEMKNLSKSVNVNLLATPLKFVQKYTNKIVAGVPSAFLLVFTLPMMFGIVMYILGHPVRAPRPDTSGDEVTRQMTTTTEVLQGRHAGQVTVTRTTTTSQEIGRVHKE